MQSPCDAPATPEPCTPTAQQELCLESSSFVKICSDSARKVSREYFGLVDGSDRDGLAMNSLFASHSQPERMDEIGKGGGGTVFKVTHIGGLQLAMKRVLLTDVADVKVFVTEGCRMSELSRGPGEPKLGLSMLGMCFSAGPNKSEVYGEMRMDLADTDLYEACNQMFKKVRIPSRLSTHRG